jgi:LPS O-antigen subunit length determinant protein (WzzB/FepE family)
MTLGFVSVSKTSPKVPLILALSVVFGGMIGVFFILVRNAIRKRKKQLSEA